MEQAVEEARRLDELYPCHKEEFVFPTHKSMGCLTQGDNKNDNDDNDDDDDNDKPVNYLCGNSLGLMPVKTRENLNKELDAWGAKAVESHFNNKITTNWMDVDLPLYPMLSKIVGAKETEVGVMGTLTMNLNSMLVSFYKPEGIKRKILFEKGSFPSDYYAFYNLARLNNLDPDDILLQIEPLKGEYNLRTSEILKLIEEKGDEIALICFSGIQYYTGQFFEMEKITKAGHDKKCLVGWDLAHAVGNINLKLHDWDVDFAVWCSYKYLNSGPGGIGGFFINERFSKGNNLTCKPRLSGWWGNKASNRFEMKEEFNPIESALGFRQSNPSVIDCCTLRTSLEIFEKYGDMDRLRKISILKTNFLEKLLKRSKYYGNGKNGKGFIIITPEDENQRGVQLSIMFKPSNIMEKVFTYMNQRGVICDDRRPDVIRLAPTPLYTSFADCVECVDRLDEALACV